MGAFEEETFLLEEILVVPQLPYLSGSIFLQKNILSNSHLNSVEIPSVANTETVQLIVGINSPGLHVFLKSRQYVNSSL